MCLPGVGDFQELQNLLWVRFQSVSAPLPDLCPEILNRPEVVPR